MYKVRVSIYPKNIKPENITKILNITPTKINTIGDIRTNSSGRTRIVKINSWFLNSKERINSNDFSEHLDYIINILDNKKEALAVLNSTDDFKMCICCACHFPENNSILSFSKEQITKLTDFGLELNFDIYFDDFLDIF